MKKVNLKESKESQVSDNSMTLLRRQIKTTLAMKEYQKQKKIFYINQERKWKLERSPVIFLRLWFKKIYKIPSQKSKGPARGGGGGGGKKI